MLLSLPTRRNIFSISWIVSHRRVTSSRLTVSLKKTNILSQDTESQPTISINNYQLDVVKKFTYLGSTVTNTLDMDPELNRRIGRATSTLARLTKRVWENSKLTTNSKMAVYRACVLSTLLYGSEYCMHTRRNGLTPSTCVTSGRSSG